MIIDFVSQEDTMLRSLSHRISCLAVVVTLALPAAALAQADTRPVVVVFTFTNSSIGAGRADFDGISTGVQDLLITDIASNDKVRLVDRSRIDAVLREQNMVKAGQIEAQTAVRIGKIMGAQYAIVGGFMADGHGTAVLTASTIDIETTQIANPQKITGKSDDVLAMIGQLSTRLAKDLVLAPKPGRRVGDGGETGAKSAPAQSGAPSGTAKSAAVETYALVVPSPVVASTMKTKLDIATMKVYSTALDEMDKKNTAKAVELFRQVRAKFPTFEPAKRNLEKLGAATG